MSASLVLSASALAFVFFGRLKRKHRCIFGTEEIEQIVVLFVPARIKPKQFEKEKNFSGV